MTNSQIAKILRNIAASYAIKDEKKFHFQIIAYQRAADSIENTVTEVEDLFREGKMDLPGVGQTISQHLEELFKTGKVKHFEEIMHDIPSTVFPLLDVPRIGPKRAFRLVKELNLNSQKTVIDDLERSAKNGKIAKLEGFGQKSQEDILRAISEFKLGSGKTKRMALPFAAELAESILSYLKKSKDVLEAFPLGSLRRKMSTIGDIDFAVNTSNSDAVIDYFTKYPNKQRVIEKGPATASILTSSGKQIDLMTQPRESFGSLLQHFTGSKNHNVHLREYALSKGLSLSEYGIKRKAKNNTWKLEKYPTEEEFYKALGMQWIPPEMREDTGEIELAIQHKLPKLVELSDVKADLHLHSSFPIEPSHDMGKNTMETMVKKASELGYEYIGFSEHNPSISKHSSNDVYSIMTKRKEKIEQLNKSNFNVRVISLLETDILPNGDLAIDDKSLDLLDITLVSIHSSFSMNKESMTKRVIQGLSYPKAKILTHPTGRMINERPGYELDFEKIFDFCKKHNKAVEINSWPQRLDLPDTLVRQAIKYGVKLVINTDSHAVEQMDLMQYGVSVARRGWAQKRDILNTLPYNDFIRWLKS